VIDYQTGGWIGGLVAGLDVLIKLADDKTRIVPADGPVLTRADLQAQRANYFTIYDRLVKSLTKGLGPEEALATEPAKGINPASLPGIVIDDAQAKTTGDWKGGEGLKNFLDTEKSLLGSFITSAKKVAPAAPARRAKRAKAVAV